MIIKSRENEINTALKSSNEENIFYKMVDTVIDSGGRGFQKLNRARKSRMHNILAFP